MKAQQQGFTLVELIVVIVILGILAATALPRFVNLGGDARAAAMQGLAGSMNSAKQLVQGKWLAAGSTGATTVPVPGAPGNDVAVTTGVGAAVDGMPSAGAGGMEDAVTVPSGVSCTTGATFVCTYTGYAGCTVTYDPATGNVTVGATAANCS